MKNNYDTKKMNFYQQETVKCKCGHSLFLPNYEPIKICRHCGNIVYKNKKVEFMYKLSNKRMRLGED
jgi:hypothetical protein